MNILGNIAGYFTQGKQVSDPRNIEINAIDELFEIDQDFNPIFEGNIQNATSDDIKKFIEDQLQKIKLKNPSNKDKVKNRSQNNNSVRSAGLFLDLLLIQHIGKMKSKVPNTVGVTYTNA
jgi:hypothetical protein